MLEGAGDHVFMEQAFQDEREGRRISPRSLCKGGRAAPSEAESARRSTVCRIGSGRSSGASMTSPFCRPQRTLIPRSLETLIDPRCSAPQRQSMHMHAWVNRIALTAPGCPTQCCAQRTKSRLGHHSRCGDKARHRFVLRIVSFETLEQDAGARLLAVSRHRATTVTQLAYDLLRSDRPLQASLRRLLTPALLQLVEPVRCWPSTSQRCIQRRPDLPGRSRSLRQVVE